MKSPAVSGAQSYKELCLAAKNEEKRQAELKKKTRVQQEDLPRTKEGWWNATEVVSTNNTSLLENIQIPDKKDHAAMAVADMVTLRGTAE